MRKQGDNHTAAAIIIGWGLILILCDRFWPGEPFYFWLGVAAVALGLAAFTPWGTKL